MLTDRPFRMVIAFSSLHEFAAFCAILRDEQVDEAKLSTMLKTLKRSNDALQAAESAEHDSHSK